MLLVSMPFGALERQALGLSLLKPQVAGRGVRCDLRYLNFVFADSIGLDDYQWVTHELPHVAFAGEWCFAEALYGPRPHSDRRYLEEVLRDTWRRSPADLERLRRIRARTGDFLDYCLEAVPWGDYQVVGFTSTFEQNLASLALARRLKERHPRLRVAFGGANWEGEMGEELHARFPFVDFAFSGEADETFPVLVSRLATGAGDAEAAAGVPGVLFREAGRTTSTGGGAPVEDMNRLPLPDYADYFRDLGGASVGASVVPTLLFETSRGCWWGAKSHCTFCGLNGGAMSFRSKSPARALHELRTLVETWRLELLEAVDNILDMRYFAQVLPALGREGHSLQIFYEVKANLSRAQVRTLRAAGITRIQPGIESLSDHVLDLMRKGTTALRNVQLLKWCKEYGIAVEWNLLYGFPGETTADYDQVLGLMRAIRFLGAPGACGPVRLDRFSPYFDRAESFGLTNLRPVAAYQYVYPFEPSALQRIAYYFDFDYGPAVDPGGAAAEAVAFAEAWRRDPEPGALTAVLRPDGTVALVDTRRGAAPSPVILAGLERAAYEHCDSVRSLDSIVAHLERRFPGCGVQGAALAPFLDSLIANDLMVTDGTHYLSLALLAYPLEATDGDGAHLSPRQPRPAARRSSQLQVLQS